MFMTSSIDVISISQWVRRREQQYLIVHIGKSEAEVTNNKRLHLRYCSVEANYRQTQSCGLPVTAELLVTYLVVFSLDDTNCLC